MCYFSETSKHLFFSVNVNILGYQANNEKTRLHLESENFDNGEAGPFE